MTRNLFQWETPAGVSIEQVFLPPRPVLSGALVYPVEFVARRGCGAASSQRAARSDAIDELDGHACAE